MAGNKIQSIVAGLQLILESKSNKDVCAEHDIIYAGDVSSMTSEQNEQMKSLGWHHNSEFDCWAIFV